MMSEDSALNSIAKYLLLICSIPIWLSCSEQDEELVIPESIIDKDVFSEILADVTLIQSMKNLNATKEMMVRDSIGAFYLAVWEEHGINESSFTESFNFYKEHPELMAEIYAESASILKRLEKQAEKRANERTNSVRSTTLDSLNDRRAHKSKSIVE